MPVDAIDSVGSSYSGPSVGSVSKVDKNEFQREDNIFAAGFDGISGLEGSSGLEETSGTLASNNEPSGNLFEESAGQLASNDIRDFQFEESAGQLASGGLNLIA